ncbi:hypothetical protein ACLOJK_027566 [Asimina triloba]
MESASADSGLSSPQACPYLNQQQNISGTVCPRRSNETHISIVTSLAISRITSRRQQLALLEAIARSIQRRNPEALRLSPNQTPQNCNDSNINQCTYGNDEDNVGSIVPRMHTAGDSMPQRGLPVIWALHLARLLQHRLVNFIDRPIHSSFILTHHSSSQNDASTQSEDATPAPSNEVALQSRHQGIWSALFLQRPEGGLLEGSLSLRMLTEGILGPSRLAFEDILVLSQTSLYHISELHDQHADMRLDVDNMSYEELLALEDRIGNVNTGLGEDTVIQCLRHSKCTKSREEISHESCSICQEEYGEEDDMGTLDCEHHFHVDCIKQWLRCKNVCPVCKSTGLTASNTHHFTNS